MFGPGGPPMGAIPGLGGPCGIPGLGGPFVAIGPPLIPGGPGGGPWPFCCGGPMGPGGP